MNLAEARKKVLQLLDENKPKNVLTDKFNDFFDSAQKQVALVCPILKTLKISQANATNKFLLPNMLDQFSIRPHYSEDVFIPSESGMEGACAYFFSVDDAATIYIEHLIGGVWTALTTIDAIVPIEGYSHYKGLIEATGKVRMRFSGNTYYRFRNTALWGVKYSGVDKIPSFEQFTDYKMPADFHELVAITKSGGLGNFDVVQDFKWQDRLTLRLKYYDEGEFFVQYKAYPKTIDGDTPEDYELENTVEAQEACVLYVAAQANSMEHDQRFFQSFFSQYQGRLANMASSIDCVAVVQGGVNI